MLKKDACPKCPSSDAFATFDNGSQKCFSCGYATRKTEAIQTDERKSSTFKSGIIAPITSRGLDKETTLAFNYQVTDDRLHIANYYRNNQVVSQKIRTPDKQFYWSVSDGKPSLFGSQRFGNGRKLIICEGEIDAMSVSQVFSNKYAVVSVPNGAKGAKQDLINNLEYIRNFEQIVLCFDMDKVGQDAAIECAKILPIGRVSIASLLHPYKDANEMLLAGKGAELVEATWRAKPFLPDCILTPDDLLTEMLEFKMTKDASYPFPALDNMTHGLRKGEIVLLTSGVGCGKSSVTREIIYNLILQKKKVAFISLEQKAQFSALSILSLHLGQRLHLTTIDDAQKKRITDTYNDLLRDNYVGIKHSGAFATDAFLDLIRHLVIGLGVEYVFIDPITNVPMPEAGDSGERVAIDRLMLKLRELTDEDGLNFGIFMISHTKRIQGNKGHEEGADVAMSHLRGSRQLEGIPDVIIALNGNMQDETNTRTLKVLKNRPAAELGTADTLTYDKTSGRIKLGLPIAHNGEI